MLKNTNLGEDTVISSGKITYFHTLFIYKLIVTNLHSNAWARKIVHMTHIVYLTEILKNGSVVKREKKFF